MSRRNLPVCPTVFGAPESMETIAALWKPFKVVCTMIKKGTKSLSTIPGVARRMKDRSMQPYQGLG
jgi:hypothetical protein